MIVKEKVAESGHWYAKDGSPAYTVVGKTGERNTTLRDARKLGLLPSVTTIISQLSKAGLDSWKQQQVLLSALTLPKMPDEPEADWLARVMKDSKETGRQAADRGNAIHGIIQSFYEGVLADYPPYVRKVEQQINEHFGNQLWTSERSFAHKEEKYGGKVDLSSRADTVRGWEGAVIDFKTKDVALDKIDVYFEHTMQLAAYRQGLAMPTARCAIVFVNGNTNETKLIEVAEEELQKGWECYWHLLKLYYIKNGL